MTSVDHGTGTGGASGSGISNEAEARGCRPDAARFASVALLAAFAAALGLACAASDSGGMSGTGVSQGSIDSFGSIFVNGVEWDLGGAVVELDGVRMDESDLRVGMVVCVEGELDDDGSSGTARSVEFDDAIEGPLEADPVETVPGLERTFSVLGTTVVMRVGRTSFANDAEFDALAANDVVEVSGFVDAAGAIHATRIELRGVFPTRDEVELRGSVANLVRNPDGSGVFDLGPNVVRFDDATRFDGVGRSTLANGDLVEVEGTLRPSGDEIDAVEVEREVSSFGDGDREDAKVEGIVASCVESPDYCVSGIPIDDSGATFEPVGFVPAVGDQVEVEGRLDAGVLVADVVESEDADEEARDVRIDAAIGAVDPQARTLVLLGVTITVDGDTRLEDDSDLDDESLTFAELQVGQYVEVEAVSTGTNSARALSIERDDATAGDDDVRLEGPVTALDPNLPALSILGQAIPLTAGTEYRDATGQVRSEEEFFRNPGDVVLGDIVRAKDQDAAALGALLEADEVEIQLPGESIDDGDDDDDDDDDD